MKNNSKATVLKSAEWALVEKHLSPLIPTRFIELQRDLAPLEEAGEDEMDRELVAQLAEFELKLYFAGDLARVEAFLQDRSRLEQSSAESLRAITEAESSARHVKSLQDQRRSLLAQRKRVTDFNETKVVPARADAIEEAARLVAVKGKSPGSKTGVLGRVRDKYEEYSFAELWVPRALQLIDERVAMVSSELEQLGVSEEHE